MISNKTTIENSLKRLILEDDREFVAMLSGEWGIGKTYFWKKLSKEHLKNKDVIYISLFGKKSLEDIETEIITKFSKYTKNVKRYTKHLDTISNLGSKALGLPFNVSVGSILSLFNPSDFKNIVICFDDFERLSEKVSLKDVMGLISQFKEQKKCKIIMILNERELDKLSDIDGKKHNEIFALYKEKIVDYSFHYMPSQEELFEAIQEDIEKIKFCEDQVIYDFLKKIDLKNIRIMKQSLYQLNHFSFIKDKNFNKQVLNEFVELALNLFIFKSKSNYNYLKFQNMIEYIDEHSNFTKLMKRKSATQNKIRGDYTAKDNEELIINVEHERNKINYYKAPDRDTSDNFDEMLYRVFDDNENSNLEKEIYSFIDIYHINEKAIIELLKKNNTHLKKENIRKKIKKLVNSIKHNFQPSLVDTVTELYSILEENKILIPYIVQVDDLHKYFEYIEEYKDELLTDKFKDDYILSYYTDGAKFNRLDETIETYYPHLVSKLEKNKDKYFQKQITMKNLSTKLSKSHSSWNPDDEVFLAKVSAETYKRFIVESSEFYIEVNSFLSAHYKGDNFVGAIKNIKKALSEIRDESPDNKWKIDNMLLNTSITLEDKE